MLQAIPGCEQHDPAALRGFNPFHRHLRPVFRGRVESGQGPFQGGQGDHFPAGFEEPLQPALEMNEPLRAKGQAYAFSTSKIRR